MDYFSKFLGIAPQPTQTIPADHVQEFHMSWDLVKNTLLQPDERQLTKGIRSTDVPVHLQTMVDSLVWESTRTEEGGTGVCLEYLLKNDVLGTLVRLSETDRPSGIQAEVLRTVQNMVVLLDEQFLVHSAVHRAVLRLLRNCAGDDIQEQLDGRSKIMGAAGNTVRGQPSEYEEDLNLLCILCSRIRGYRELLMIFFHDKHWYRSEPLFSVEEEGEEEEDGDEEVEASYKHTEGQRTPLSAEASTNGSDDTGSQSPTLSQATVTSAEPPSISKKPEYEFLLFNYLLRFVHREGQIGEFARAGLLFLMDIAMSPGEISSGREQSSISDVLASDPVNDAALALAEYILDGDFSEVLGAGLVAVYSLLPSKLGFFRKTSEDVSESGMTIGSFSPFDEEGKMKLEALRDKSQASGIEDSQNPDFKSRLDHFLKLLEFLQDILRRNDKLRDVNASALVGTAIVQSILDAVRRIFLENVLYPSILECSDSDGSAVAVMSYIEVMIRTLHEGPLATLFVDFLVNEDNEESRARHRPQGMLTLGHIVNPPPPPSHEKQVKLKRRKSSAMVLIEMEAPDSRRQSEYFTTMSRFTLKDLLLSNLRSHSQEAATSALQLLQSTLLYHPLVCATRIMHVIPDPNATAYPNPAIISTEHSKSGASPKFEEEDEETFQYPGTTTEDKDNAHTLWGEFPLFSRPSTTYSTHEREMGIYLALISRVDPSHTADVFSTGYDHYLHDALLSIQSQPAYHQTGDDSILKHRLNVNDPILTTVLESTRKFFSNTPEFNIALTGVLATLAIHPGRSLAGWLTFASEETLEPSEIANQDNQMDEDSDDCSVDFSIEEKLANELNFLPAASMNENTRPVIHTIFHGLVTQLERYRQMVDDFDRFLLERRKGLLFSENLTDALNLALDIVEEPTVPPHAESQPKLKPKSKASSSIVSFLTPKKTKPSRYPETPNTSAPSTPQRVGNKSVAASPFGPHYQQTNSIKVEPFIAPAPSSGPWTPAKSRKWNPDEEDVFTSSAWNDGVGRMQKDEVRDGRNEISSPQKETVTLSRLLDNVVILEESIKELVAIIHARRSLGIDSIRYL